MVMYGFVPPYREATFCGVPSCVFDKLGCAADKKWLQNCVRQLHASCLVLLVQSELKF
jgi:hypothetical protein